MNLKHFFILGNPRSGTSMLRLMLDCHSAISVPPECGFLLWLYPKYNNWNSNSLNSSALIQFINDVSQSRKFETWKITPSQLKTKILDIKPKNYEELSRCVYLSYSDKANKNPMIIGDKNNYYIHHLDKLNTLYTNKAILHIVRDGRDVAASYKALTVISNSYTYKPNLSTDISEIAKEWNENNLKIYNYFKGFNNYFCVKYEDLLLNPQFALERFLSHFKLEFENEIINFYKYNRDYKSEPKETLAWKLKTLEPLDKNNIGKYKKVLSLNEIELFNEIANESLDIFSYEG